MIDVGSSFLQVAGTSAIGTTEHQGSEQRRCFRAEQRRSENAIAPASFGPSEATSVRRERVVRRAWCGGRANVANRRRGGRPWSVVAVACLRDGVVGHRGTERGIVPSDVTRGGRGSRLVVRHEPLATLGDSLGLFRRHISAGGTTGTRNGSTNRNNRFPCPRSTSCCRSTRFTKASRSDLIRPLHRPGPAGPRICSWVRPRYLSD